MNIVYGKLYEIFTQTQEYEIRTGIRTEGFGSHTGECEHYCPYIDYNLELDVTVSVNFMLTLPRMRRIWQSFTLPLSPFFKFAKEEQQ